MNIKQNIINAYIDYVNNFVSTENFASHYELDLGHAERLIALGRDIYTSTIGEEEE